MSFGSRGVALAAAGHLGVHRGLVDDDALGLGDLGEHQERLDPLLGRLPELLVEVGLGLLHDLEVGLLGDALPRDLAAELVVHHLDLLVDQHLGQLDGRVGDGVLDDLVGELVAGPVQCVRLQARPDIGPQRREVVEVAELAEEVVVELGQDLLAQLLDLDREVHGLAGELGLGVVVGEGDVELGRFARLQSDQVGLEARDQAFLAEDERHPFR